jgi:hypothetical protein
MVHKFQSMINGGWCWLAIEQTWTNGGWCWSTIEETCNLLLNKQLHVQFELQQSAHIII